MDHQEHCDALEGEIERFATVFEAVAPDLGVESCPGWNVAEVAEHLGMIHRWANQLVRRRAPERLSFEALGLVAEPVTPEWLRAGGSQLLETLRATDPDLAMWAWGPDHHVRFWSRRQLHETLVHRMDIELAAGATPEVATGIAVDAIDEFLANLGSATRFSPKVNELRGTGETLGIRERDSGARWNVTLLPDRFEVARGESDVDAEFAGPALDLLLTLYRRRRLGESGVTLAGDARLGEFWLEHSALE